MRGRLILNDGQEFIVEVDEMFNIKILQQMRP